MNYKVYVMTNQIDKFYREAIKEYEKRLSRYCKTELIQIKDRNQLLKKLPDRSYKIGLSSRGKDISSEELAQKINTLGLFGNSDVDIIIGIDDLPCDERLSVSTMDMDLGLLGVIIFEQLYRGYRILNNQPYHK